MLRDYLIARHYRMTLARVRALSESERRLMLAFLVEEIMGER